MQQGGYAYHYPCTFSFRKAGAISRPAHIGGGPVPGPKRGTLSTKCKDSDPGMGLGLKLGNPGPLRCTAAALPLAAVPDGPGGWMLGAVVIGRYWPMSFHPNWSMDSPP